MRPCAIPCGASAAVRRGRRVQASGLPAGQHGCALPAARRSRVRADRWALRRRTVAVVDALVHRSVAIVAGQRTARRRLVRRGAVASGAAIAVDAAVARDARVAVAVRVRRSVAGAGLARRASRVGRAGVVGAGATQNDPAVRLDAAAVSTRRALRVRVAGPARAAAVAGRCGLGALATRQGGQHSPAPPRARCHIVRVSILDGS